MVDEGDRLLPIANVGRIMKNTLPPTAKISKGAKETMQECVSEFISFVTGEASDKCHKENRKTVNGDDVCWALSSLGFDNYAEVMARYLHKLRLSERERAANTLGNMDIDAAKNPTVDQDSSYQQNLDLIDNNNIIGGKLMDISSSSSPNLMMPLEFTTTNVDYKGKGSNFSNPF